MPTRPRVRSIGVNGFKLRRLGKRPLHGSNCFGGHKCYQRGDLYAPRAVIRISLATGGRFQVPRRTLRADFITEGIAPSADQSHLRLVNRITVAPSSGLHSGEKSISGPTAASLIAALVAAEQRGFRFKCRQGIPVHLSGEGFRFCRRARSGEFPFVQRLVVRAAMGTSASVTYIGFIRCRCRCHRLFRPGYQAP
jgi:hypothetical protein